jgi:hypothetical protein
LVYRDRFSFTFADCDRVEYDRVGVEIGDSSYGWRSRYAGGLGFGRRTYKWSIFVADYECGYGACASDDLYSSV